MMHGISNRRLVAITQARPLLIQVFKQVCVCGMWCNEYSLRGHAHLKKKIKNLLLHMILAAQAIFTALHHTQYCLETYFMSSLACAMSVRHL